MGFILLFALLALIVIVVLSARKRESLREAILPEENLRVESDSFEQDGEIPERFSGYGEDLSPSLNWSKLDKKAKSVVVFMDDLDHPMGIFNHWVIWNIPASLTGLPEGIGHGVHVNEIPGAVQGKSEYGGKHYYRGPKPPMGTHRYRFQVFVLETILDIPTDSTKLDVIRTMDDYLLQYGSITGIYGRN